MFLIILVVTGSQSNMADDRLEFWDAHPCGGSGTFPQRAAFRYQCEPWLQPLIREVSRTHRAILEVGCGQGLDGCYLTAGLAAGGRYLGIDKSPESVRMAEESFAEARNLMTFNVVPEFRVGDATRLDVPREGFDCVFSIGVMHHSGDTARCVDQAFEALQPGGTAYIALYRKYSPKVGVAKALRSAQRAADALTSTDRSIYRLVQQYGRSKHFGTMFLECFGVPHMDWFTRREMMAMFSRFHTVELETVGGNVLRGGPRPNPLGYMWLAKAHKR
jgi:SAM-dependent methyltransferase